MTRGPPPGPRAPPHACRARMAVRVQARYAVRVPGSLAAFQIIIVGQASGLEETRSFGRMAEFVPAFLQRGLGSQWMLLVTFKGTVAFGYFTRWWRC